MNTKQMEYIIELAKAKNFNRAAESLYISQPALTYQIRTVEDEIGFRIFERSGKGINLTPAGEQFLPAVVSVLTQINDAIDQGRRMEEGYKMTITIKLPTLAAIARLPEAIKRQRKIWPEILVSPRFSTSPAEERRKDEEADISFALHESVSRLPGYREFPLYESRVFAILPADDPHSERKVLKNEELAQYTLSVYYNNQIPSVSRIYQAARDIHPKGIVPARDVDSALLIPLSGAGAAVLPEFMVPAGGGYSMVPCELTGNIKCSLITQINEHRDTVISFVRILQDIYRG